jgi:hypothetical protein
MTNAIMLSFSGNDATRLKIASLYWEVASDGTWQYPVKQIADHFGVPPSKIPTLSAEIAIAFSVQNPCRACKVPLGAVSRADFARISSRATTLCTHCKHEQQVAEQTKKAQEKKSLRERQSAIWLSETSRDPLLTIRI